MTMIVIAPGGIRSQVYLAQLRSRLATPILIPTYMTRIGFVPRFAKLETYTRSSRVVARGSNPFRQVKIKHRFCKTCVLFLCAPGGIRTCED